MEYHVGSTIKKRLEEVGISKNEFARRINRTPQNVFSIFERESLDTGLLLDISKVLNFDFFRKFNVILLDPLQNKNNPSKSDSVELNAPETELIAELKNEILKLKTENDYLKEINALLREKNK